MDYFELLKEKLKKPTTVYNCGNDEMWESVERKEGIVFPNDYKKFINYYGTGGIDNYFWILTPFEKDENINFIMKCNIMLDSYMKLKDLFPEDYVYDVFPNEKGILPCAYAENGDEVYWLTSRNIEEWEIILYDATYSAFRHYKMGFVEFMYKILSEEIKSQLIVIEKEKYFCSIKV